MPSDIVLRVVMLDTQRTSIAARFENERVPYGRRLVSIPLTPEQVALLSPRETGVSNGRTTVEEYGDSWIEALEAPDAS